MNLFQFVKNFVVIIVIIIIQDIFLYLAHLLLWLLVPGIGFPCAYSVFTVVENYAKNNCTWNWLQFFWPAWYVVTEGLHICYFGLAAIILGIWGCVKYLWIGLEKYLFNDILYVPIFLNAIANWKRKIRNRLVTAYQLVKRTTIDFGCGFFWQSFLPVLG